MPASAPPYRPSTGTFSARGDVHRLPGVKLARPAPTSRPYQATPAFTLELWAQYSQVMRPPQQKPVMARRVTSPWPRRFGPAYRRIEVAHHLRVGHLADDLLDDLADVGQPGHVALPHEEIGRDGEVADLRKPPANVADVLVHAEDLLHHQHHRERAAGRPAWRGRPGSGGPPWRARPLRRPGPSRPWRRSAPRSDERPTRIRPRARSA